MALMYVHPADMRGVRRLLHETQETFADRFGVCRRTVIRWETHGARLSHRPHAGYYRLATQVEAWHASCAQACAAVRGETLQLIRPIDAHFLSARLLA